MNDLHLSLEAAILELLAGGKQLMPLTMIELLKAGPHAYLLGPSQYEQESQILFTLGAMAGSDLVTASEYGSRPVLELKFRLKPSPSA